MEPSLESLSEALSKKVSYNRDLLIEWNLIKVLNLLLNKIRGTCIYMFYIEISGIFEFKWASYLFFT